MTSNVIQHDDRLCYDIYDRFTMEHFPLCQNMALTTSFFCSRQYLSDFFLKSLFFIKNKFVTFEISKFILFWTKRLILLRKHTSLCIFPNDDEEALKLIIISNKHFRYL
jgi:hypothetical protein